MKLKGGYDVCLSGRPEKVVEELPEPETLYLPLKSRRFNFSELCVKDGQQVLSGQALAKDPDNYSVPLIAPRAGKVNLEAVEGHITLEDITKVAEEPFHPDEETPHVIKNMSSVGIRRYKLLALGAWQFLCDAYSGELPNPLGTPSAVIVSTLRLEPYIARGDVQLYKRLVSFTRGLEHLQSLLEYQPIYLVLPDIKSDFASKVREVLRGYAWVKMIQIPLRYPLCNFNLIARHVGLKADEDNPVWAMHTEGVLAIDRALTLSRSSSVRIVSLGGPAAETPRHLKAIPGYPLQAILESRITHQQVRCIDGGILRGDIIESNQRGLDTECAGLTVLAEHSEREFLGFVRPGWNRRSYSNCFLSCLRRSFSKSSKRLNTALRGERRPCVSCNFCEEVCSAGIMPYLIHKYLYQDEIEEAERARIDLCIECGLCSFVCPSKIDLREEFINAKKTIRQELHAQEVEA